MTGLNGLLVYRVIITLLKYMGFVTQVCDFFVDYLVECLMWYAWEGKLFPPFETSVGMGQDSALSPILSALCLVLVLWQAALDVPEVALMFYINDGTIIVQSKIWGANLTKLRSAYSVVFELIQSLGLVLEHDKSEVFHFSRKSGDANPPVDLSYAPFTGRTLSTDSVPKTSDFCTVHASSQSLCTALSCGITREATSKAP